MGQSPPSSLTNKEGRGLPLLNGPTEFGLFHPSPVQWTTQAAKEARAGDVLFCVRGSTTGRMNRADELCAIGRGIAAVRGATTSDSRFVEYALRNSMAELLAGVTGSTFPNISRSQLSSHPIPIPKESDRWAIAEVLGALDDKIAANSRLTGTSQSLAKAEWERANNHTVEYLRLRDVATLNYGKSLPAKRRVAGDVQVVGSGGVTGTHDQALVAEAGIVVGRKGTAGAVHWIHGPHFPIDTTFFVTPTGGLTSHFLYYELTSMRLTEMNSDSAVPGLNREEAYAAPVRHPDQSSMRRFNEVVPVLFDQFAQIEAESRSLATTRDALLPLLMSGKVTVQDAEAMVGEVV
ncbi:restriction endonuclease subunit S [Janibacter sp. G349]